MRNMSKKENVSFAYLEKIDYSNVYTTQENKGDNTKFNKKEVVIYQGKIWEVKRYINNEICEIYQKEGHSETFMLVDEKLLKGYGKVGIVRFKIGELVLFQNEVCRVTGCHNLKHGIYYDITNLKYNCEFVAHENDIKSMECGGFVRKQSGPFGIDGKFTMKFYQFNKKKYYIHQPINNQFLNFVILDKRYIMFDSKNVEGFQTQFTQQEIDNFPQEIKGAIECGFLRKVEVE